MESVIGKAIDLVCEYTVVPIAHQLQYVFCYESRVAEMKDSINKLQNEKQIVDREKTAALHNIRLIHNKTEAWLEAVTKAQDEVSSLIVTNEQQMMSGCVIGGQILNPVARHKLGRKATKKKQDIEDLCRDRPQHDHEISYAPPPPGIVDHQATSETNDRVFRSSRWKQLMEEIMVALKDERKNVIGLYGMGGVGKSTMINEVYDQVKKQCMFDEVIKVEVKVKPEIRRIQEEIAFALGLKFENESPTVRAEKLNQRLLWKKVENNDKDQKKKKSVLIILDDLWVKLDLQEVGIPSSGNDQVYIKLFLTSRREDVLSDKMGARNPIHLDVLSDADALRMFRFVVGVGAEGVNDDKVTEITRKCSGLPIVIEAIAKALKDRPLDEWEKILKRLDNDDVLEKLKVSYDYLPSKESKELFLICGISRGPSIQVRDLLKYTFGLRLYNIKDSSTLGAAAAKLEELLSRLEAASMLLKSDDNRYVKIHDHMRELAVKIVAEDRPEWAHDVTLADNSYWELLPNASELKLLISCWEGDVVELGDSFLKDMKKLNVLEFRNLRASLPILSSSTIQLDHLRNLGTLCLHSCVLDDISMIGELKGLQILSFQGSDIRKLPIQLRELTMLKMLDLSDCEELMDIEPNVLGSLTKLEELNMENSYNDWEIDQEDDVSPSNARLIELKNMSRLNNVRIHILSTSMLPKGGQLFSSKLSMYRITVGSSLHRRFSDEYSKFSRVLMLTLDEYSSDIFRQDWVQTTLQTTEGLYLSGYEDGKYKIISEMCTKGFETLKHLRMMNCPSFQFIISSNDDSFTNLESLLLENLKSLEKLCGGQPRNEKAFNKLRVMKVKYCDKLTHLFDFSLLKSHISSQLEEITVESCPEIQCIVVGEGNNNCDVVTLSNLQKLNFRKLRKFSSFYAASPSSNVLFTGKKVAFPCLESLIIERLDKLEDIWHPTDPPAELGKLRFLQVEACHKLVRAINSNVLMRLQRDLETLQIENCRLMKEVFDVNDRIISTNDEEHDLVLFSRLKELQLQEMDGLEGLHNNKNVMMKGGRLTITIFPNIESLDVYRCDRLRYVLCCSLPTTNGIGGGGGVYENLKEIRIFVCEEIEAIIVVMLRKILVDQETQPIANATTIGDDSRHHHNSYSSLEKIGIEGCHELRTFCQYLCSQHDSVVDDMPFFSLKEIFPSMKSLSFRDSSTLGEIWPHEVPSDQTSFNMLKEVEIYRCRELSVVFPSTMIPRLENLTELKVESCNELMQIVHGGGGSSDNRIDEDESMKMMFTFPSLTRLELNHLPKLERFYSSSSVSACGFQFPSLETLIIWKCSKVIKTLFSHDLDTDMVGALFRSCDSQLAIPNLKSIDLYDLGNLTKIWKGDKSQGLFLKLESLSLSQCSSSSCTDLESLLSVGVAASLSCWNVLTELVVEHCKGLEYLLTPLGATSLMHLTRLSIRRCRNIKEVVVAVEEEEAAANNEENQGDHHISDTITFSYLKVLQLKYLWRLQKFSSVKNRVLSLPSLEILDIQNCPNMTTFSSGIAIASSTQKFGDLNSFVQMIH